MIFEIVLLRSVKYIIIKIVLDFQVLVLNILNFMLQKLLKNEVFSNRNSVFEILQ